MKLEVAFSVSAQWDKGGGTGEGLLNLKLAGGAGIRASLSVRETPG